MSLIRQHSKTTLKASPEDLLAALQQKNQMISSLQNELENFRPNEEKFDRIKEQLTKIRFKYECLLRDQESLNLNNSDRLQLSVRTVQDLRIQSEHLKEQLKLKIQNLKDLLQKKQQWQQICDKKEEEASECILKLQQQRNNSEGLKMEGKRTRAQIGQIREQVIKMNQENSQGRCQFDQLSQRIYKTQSYIRGLKRQESNLNQSHSRTKDENSNIDSSISQLTTLISVNESVIKKRANNFQNLLFVIANKQLQRKKIEQQTRQVMKQLACQKQKSRILSQQQVQKSHEKARLNEDIATVSSQISYIMAESNNVQEINSKMIQDLTLCEKHHQNLLRARKNLENQIQKIKQMSIKAINKLQQPLNFKSDLKSPSTGFSKWSNEQFQARPVQFQGNNLNKWTNSTSKLAIFQTGDFQAITQRT